MYTIYAGNKLIYSPTLASHDFVVVDPTQAIEVNKASTLTFLVPSANQRIALLELLTSSGAIPEIKVYDDGQRLFKGRILTNVKDFMKSSLITCEGDLAYLRDVIVRPSWTHTGTPAEYFQYLIGKYNSIVPAGKQFTIGTVTCASSESKERSTDQYIDVMSEITDKLLNQYGGFIRTYCEVVSGVEVSKIDWVTEPGAGNQLIKYGRNLLDLKETQNIGPVYTRIIPLGANQEGTRVTIPGLYITDSTAVAKYGLIEHVETFDDITSAVELEAAGEDALEKGITPEDTLELTAVDMSLVGESNERLTVGKTYRIYSPGHGFTEASQTGRLNRAELKLARYDESRFIFGNAKATITQEAVQTQRAMNQVTKLALESSQEIQELKDKIEEIAGADYIAEVTTAGSWKKREWDSGRVEYYLDGGTITWGTWTASGSVYTSSGDITLPATISSYQAFVTINGSKPLAISCEKTSTKITVHAVGFESSLSTSDVSVIVIKL